MDLSYLITVWTNEVEDEHRLLWQVLTTLFRHPVLPDDVLAGQLAGQPYPVETSTSSPMVMKNPADFWAALDNKLKPSINYVVTLPMELGIVFTAPEVRTKVVDIRPLIQCEQFVQVGGFVRKGVNSLRLSPGYCSRQGSEDDCQDRQRGAVFVSKAVRR